MRCIALAAIERSTPYLEATAACAQSSVYMAAGNIGPSWPRLCPLMAMDKNGTYSWMVGQKYSKCQCFSCQSSIGSGD